jgi:ABC-type transport system involved in cytochrome c biogenesis permease subunit
MALYAVGMALALFGAKAPAKSCAWLGWLVQAVLLASRWNVAGFLPVTGLFSTLHFLTLWLVAITLYFIWRYGAIRLLPATLAVALVALWKAGDGDMNLAPLTPALDTPLFFLHVASSFAAYGMFVMAAMLSLYRLAGIDATPWGHERRMLDEALYLGYILFSWCMIAGSLWAYLAWGSYWTWRIKGLWSAVLWFYYSGVIHVRNKGRWQGWPVDVLSLCGCALMIFTFLGLGLLFETSHPLR